MVCYQSLAPKAKELKEKYGRNKALLNQLTAKLYENANVNPLAGCLPALAQIPIFLALYRSLLQLAQEQVLDEPFLWLPRYVRHKAPPIIMDAASSLSAARS